MKASKRPPPLQLLPAFEASARLLSFSKAAQELHLTTSAISQQIKQLEELLGQPLFLRLTRRIELTDAGAQFFQVASKTLSIYRQGHAEFVHEFGQPELRLSMTPLIAHEFVLPQVESFQSSHPDVSISIEGSMDVVDFDAIGIDAAIRVGSGKWAGLTAWPVCECEAVLLASPALLAQHPIEGIQDLEQHTLIRRRHEQFGWDDLGALLGQGEVNGKGALLVDSDLAALHAAERGLGVVLSFLPVGTSIEAVWPGNRFTAVLPPVPTPLKAWFVFRTGSSKTELLQDAFTWVRSLLS
ncbi:DNA-binding transcriptional activator GcvA [Alcanivorax sp. MD8A]|uniref:LysR substrate-binding domain-containing protein n=1 Tax=Alcanivorax sp. MD8A TaxID=1177157 RepID=UPI000C9BB828|nr:LysR substrate-binding domain-containing protein [Alcanivorax sp. MD8A]PNE02131.1 DNA-binding transcriptional activator GcvA [Alcanivorax sp. MD8A]